METEKADGKEVRYRHADPDDVRLELQEAEKLREFFPKLSEASNDLAVCECGRERRLRGMFDLHHHLYGFLGSCSWSPIGLLHVRVR